MSVYQSPKKSGRWHASWADYSRPAKPDGRRHNVVVRVPTQAIGRRVEHQGKALQREVKLGLKTPAEARRADYANRTLLDQLPDYLHDLQASKRSQGHVAATAYRLGKLLPLCPFDRASEATAEGLRRAMVNYQAAEPKTKNGRKPGQHAANKAAGALKGLLNWMVDNGRLEANPLDRAKLPRVTEVIHPRRAASPEVFTELRAAALDMPTRGRWTKLDRVQLLRILYVTGFRVNECRSLRPESFHLDSKQPFIVVEAAYSKSRRRVEQPISLDDAFLLCVWLRGKPLGKPVFPMGRNFKMSEMMQAVCRRAGVPYRDAEGFLDGHALRHSYITNLAQRTDLKTVQSLARHGDAKMTLRYMHTDNDKRRKAVEGQ